MNETGMKFALEIAKVHLTFAKLFDNPESRAKAIRCAQLEIARYWSIRKGAYSWNS